MSVLVVVFTDEWILVVCIGFGLSWRFVEFVVALCSKHPTHACISPTRVRFLSWTYTSHCWVQIHFGILKNIFVWIPHTENTTLISRARRQPTIGNRLARRLPNLVVACCVFQKTVFRRGVLPKIVKKEWMIPFRYPCRCMTKPAKSSTWVPNTHSHEPKQKGKH